MKGWLGNILRVNLTDKTFRKESFSEEFAKKWIGGRGFATKILYDELKPGIDPLGPENKFIVALGPISGIPAPNTGKAVVAAKSPLTGGYGDGNMGTYVSIHLRKAGYDILIVEGKADSPTCLYIKDDEVEFLPADEIWGKGTYDSQKWLYEKFGKQVGAMTIGQGGENLVKFAIVRSLEGRAGGRPGMGAVMGSKNLKAIVVKGTKDIPVADPEKMRKDGKEGMKEAYQTDKKIGWSKQATNGVLAWCNETNTLPVRNMRKTSHPDAWKIDGQRLDEARVATYGCPNCTFHCGITIHDSEKRESELDYENIGLLGASLEIFNLQDVGSLNYLCDDYGLDTISAGDVLAFYADAIDHGATEGDFKFGDAKRAIEILGMIAKREGVGDILADGSYRAALKFGNNSLDYAMQVKGMEISAYNCKFLPGMALAFGTSPIGAHHKESWVITYEISETPREAYSQQKVDKIIELQRIRGGLFEFIVSCRFPWVELGMDLNIYTKYFKDATGIDYTLDDFWKIADRIYSLMKLFWLREDPDWDRTRDYVPEVWFDPANADKEGPIAGKILEKDKYDEMLTLFYDARGWDDRGIPTMETIKRLDLEEEAKSLPEEAKLK